MSKETYFSDLELLSSAISEGEFYCISDAYRHCGWIDYPHSLIRRKTGEHVLLKGDHAEALCYCNGKIACNSFAIPDKIKKSIHWLESLGYIRKCSYGEDTSLPYVFYNNREINFLSWAITGACNLRCRHCFVSAPDAKFGELSTEDCLKIIDEIASCGVTILLITGGEPLFRKDLPTLLGRMKEHEIVLIGIGSNGTLVNDRILDLLDSLDYHPEFKMSYDGVEGWHDWLRGIPGTEDRLLSSMRKLQDRSFSTMITMTVHKGNLPLMIPSLLKMKEYGCSFFKTNKMFDNGEWLKFGAGKEVSYEETYEEYLQVIKYLYTNFRDGMPLTVLLSPFITINKGEINYRLVSVLNPHMPPERTLACSSMYRHFHISGDGTIQPCLVMSSIDYQHKKLPYVHKDGLIACMNDPQFLRIAGVKIQEVLDHNPECTDCKYAKYCIGGCRAFGCMDNATDELNRSLANCIFFRDGYAKRTVELISELCPEAKCINVDIDELLA